MPFHPLLGVASGSHKSPGRGFLLTVGGQYRGSETHPTVRESHAGRSNHRNIRHFSILRNEVKSKAGRGGELSIADDRTQRHTLGLKDVAYVIRADVWLPPNATEQDGRPVDAAKYRDQFQRRVAKGQCWQRPYLGCREFAADFGPPDGTERPIDQSDALGRMLFDIDYAPQGNQARYFEAHLENGVLHVPPALYETGDETGGAP